MDAILGEGRAGIRLTATSMSLGKERESLRRTIQENRMIAWLPLRNVREIRRKRLAGSIEVKNVNCSVNIELIRGRREAAYR